MVNLSNDGSIGAVLLAPFEAFKFKNWDADQPSAASGHNFLILNGKNGKWADTTDFSGKVKGYVCEWKGTAPKDAGPKDSELKAPKG